MSGSFSLAWLAGPVLLGVISFFAYALLQIKKEVNELWQWHNITGADGRKLWYANSLKDLEKILEEHVNDEMAHLDKIEHTVNAIHTRQSELVAHGDHIEKVHSKLATISMQLQALDTWLRLKCGENPKGGL